MYFELGMKREDARQPPAVSSRSNSARKHSDGPDPQSDAGVWCKRMLRWSKCCNGVRRSAQCSSAHSVCGYNSTTAMWSLTAKSGAPGLHESLPAHLAHSSLTRTWAPCRLLPQHIMVNAMAEPGCLAWYGAVLAECPLLEVPGTCSDNVNHTRAQASSLNSCKA